MPLSTKDIHPYFSINDGRLHWERPRFPCGPNAQTFTQEFTFEEVDLGGNRQITNIRLAMWADPEYEDACRDAMETEFLQLGLFGEHAQNVILDLDQDRPCAIVKDPGGKRHIIPLDGTPRAELKGDVLTQLIEPRARQFFKHLMLKK